MFFLWFPQVFPLKHPFMVIFPYTTPWSSPLRLSGDVSGLAVVADSPHPTVQGLGRLNGESVYTVLAYPTAKFMDTI